MRYLVACGIVLAVFLSDARTGAQAQAWCANYSDGGRNCGFYTQQQCLIAVSGVGGACTYEPWWDERRERWRRHQRRDRRRGH